VGRGALRRGLALAAGCGLIGCAVGAALLAPAAALCADAPATAPPAGLMRWLDPSTAPFIPIPEIDIEPHSGLTLGVIPTVLFSNERGELDRIIAPDLIHSQYFGWGSRVRVYEYPSEDTQWSVIGGLKQRVEREFDARYATGQTRAGRYSGSVETIYDRSGIPRFFGIGNDTRRADETSYLDDQGRVDAVIGRNFTAALQLAYVARLRVVSVRPGVLARLPSIEVRFPGQNGIGTEHEVRQSLALSYDTRDSPTVPRSGARYVLYGGFASRRLGSSFADSAFGVDARHYWRLDANHTLAAHATLRYMPSARGAPFWALSSVGGDRSVLDEREPLRAYGDDRFIDRNLFATGIELRTRALNVDAFATHLSVELAPFIDLGKVYGDVDGSPFSRLHRAVGLGIRGVASPFVVGYLDIGYGHDRAAVFSGINYPF
jgi:hypothetical protein